LPAGLGPLGGGAPEKAGEGWDGASFGGRSLGLIREQVVFPIRSQEDCLGETCAPSRMFTKPCTTMC